MQFIENEVYDFFVENLIKLPDGEYFVLNYENKRKFLLPAYYYHDYQIEKNKYIKCYINKINCNGQIFLEPLHPIYKIGDVDIFYLYAVQTRIKRKTNDEYKVILARNKKTKRAYVKQFPIDIIEHIPLETECKIIGFKKGEVILAKD
ncbi:MAG: hypothetical protein N3A01_09845 [Bacteroidales bacterium]|nr:hypothetical protein [Bacteroidales bacterium]